MLFERRVKVLTQEEFEREYSKFKDATKVIEKGAVGTCVIGSGLLLGNAINTYSAVVDEFVINTVPSITKEFLRQGGLWIGGPSGYGLSIPMWFCILTVIYLYIIGRTEIVRKKREKSGYYDAMPCMAKRREATRKLIRGENIK